VIGSGLQKEQVVCAVIFPGHTHQCFVVDALFIATKSAPVSFVLKDGMEKGIDGKRFSGSCIPGDQPTSAKVVSFPIETAD
jgi:hypothetical protein